MSHNDKKTVAANVLLTNAFPILNQEIIKKGIFSTNVVTPSGIPPSINGRVSFLTIIAIPEKPPITSPHGSYTHFTEKAKRPVPRIILMNRYNLLNLTS